MFTRLEIVICQWGLLVPVPVALESFTEKVAVWAYILE